MIFWNSFYFNYDIEYTKLVAPHVIMLNTCPFYMGVKGKILKVSE